MFVWGAGGEPHAPAQVPGGASSGPGASESGPRGSRRPGSWAGHGAVSPGSGCPRTCAALRPPGRLDGRRGSSPAGEDARHHPRARLSPACTAAVKFTPPQGPGRGGLGVPRCPPSPRGLHFLLPLTNSAPPPPSGTALSLPLKISARRSTPQAEAVRLLLSVPCSFGCPANPARRRDGREADPCAERRRRRRNSQAPASRSRALRSGQRGLSGARLAQALSVHAASNGS
ncbi:U1 small nuclear ribonucleoprotein C-like [Delphinapterus leucas]|uniref:U1 small nuclear ribonucleoprotein C-like n=1 Tax=Delphinapterus leucas TaxID=9749 RepID=A0A7F8K950_DELLE|nr:U1 small nuclear ribonucleoprotein C-like [Delphinapterus leucas]